jgi:hypothetical protein
MRILPPINLLPTMNKINFITPCSRPENLNEIGHSILRGAVEPLQNHFIPSNEWKIRWWIVFDTNLLDADQINKASVEISDADFSLIQPTLLINGKSGSAGHQHRNLALDVLENREEKGWLYNIDDDNILHEDFHLVLKEGVLRGNMAAVIVNQVLKNGELNRSPVDGTELTAHPENMRVYRVDTAQAIFNLEKIKGRRFTEWKYNADGLFIESLFEEDGNFSFINKNLCYYNYLA